MANLSDLMLANGVVNYPVWFQQIDLPNWPMPHQTETLRRYARQMRFLDASDPGCVSADTEYLTPSGWKRIDDYAGGDLVAQFHPDDRSMSFALPHRYVKEPCEWLYHAKPREGLEMKLSKDHRVLSFTVGGGHYRVDSMSEVVTQHENSVNGWRGLICTTPGYEGNAEIDLTDEQLRVMVMVQADGSFTAETGTRCNVRVLKDRKKERCKELLTAAGIPFKEYPAPRNYSVFTFYAPLRQKTYPHAWMEAPIRQKLIILEECRHWDGSLRKAGAFVFHTTVKEDADFIQFLAVTSGRNSNVKSRRHQITGSPFTEYTVYIRPKGLMNSLYSGSNKSEIKKIPTEDGFKYCFTVPSGFLVLRCNGKVFTTGNCGKTFPAQTHAVLMAALGNKVVFTMPPKLIGQFQQELLDFFQGINKFLKIDNLDVPSAKKAKLMQEWDSSGWPDILILSYDVYRMLNDNSPMKKIGENLWFRQDGSPFFKEKGEPYDKSAQPFTKDGRPINKRGKATNPHQFRLKKAGYNVLFFDEAHALCGTESILSQSVSDMSVKLGDDVAIYLMTGTPIPTHLHDVFGILRLVNPEAYPNKMSFQRQHCLTSQFTINNGKKDVKITQITGYKAVDKVYDALWKNAVRVQKRDVLTLPDPVVSQIRIRLSGSHLTLYKKILNDRFAVLGDKVLAPDNQSALRHLALQLISCPDEFDSTGKIGQDNELSAAADAVMDSINPANHKVIIFAYYKRTIDFLAKRYARWNPAVVYGESSSGRAEVDRFKNDPACRVAIINWKSGGAGLNLQVASHLMFYECPTSPGDAKQAIARADRKGQQNIVNVYFMRVLGTLLDRNFKNLLKNEQENNQAIRDTKDLLHELLR